MVYCKYTEAYKTKTKSKSCCPNIIKYQKKTKANGRGSKAFTVNISPCSGRRYTRETMPDDPAYPTGKPVLHPCGAVFKPAAGILLKSAVQAIVQ